MALSETNVLKIAQILNRISLEVEQQINLMGSRLTSTVQTLIEAQILLWDTASVDYVSVDPNVKNFGARINAGDARNAIRQRIAILLEKSEWGSSGGLVRG